ncbi:uncharacterized protein LOC126708736 [Quercus robur]|uniref:uncharacterized protein LOC126708736 n=1 Tax=Quercus robur TaxID=38942 RepID=UPI0021629872|nr:uncharacterized protein LOC126708736 [Quercus robur]XP_050264606.1 uncharacterized protein LOC126708736 [Quercus robur]
MENPQHLPTSVAVHEHFEKDKEPVIERSEHDETSENLTSTKYIDPSRVEDSSNLQDLAVLEVELTAIQGIHGESIGVSNIFFALGILMTNTNAIVLADGNFWGRTERHVNC